MSDISEQYTDEMKDQFHFYAAWFPGTTFELGDIGTLDGNQFERNGTLKTRGFDDFEIRSDETDEDLEFNSKGGVKITIKLAGSVSPPGSALATADLGFIVEFEDEY